METRIAVGDPQAIRLYATKLAVDYARQLWWSKFIGSSENSIVHEMIDLESNAGDRIQYDLSMRLRGEGVFGDDRAEGKEENLKFMIDEILIDQVRKPVDGGGRMTQKRTLHDIRKVMKARTSEWLAEWMEEVIFCYASGVPGSSVANEDALFASANFAGNPIEAPDAAHLIYGGVATSKATVAATDKMSADLIRRVATKAKMLNARSPDVVAMRPVNVDGGKHFVVVMSEDQSYDLRTGGSATEWLEIQKAAGQRGSSNPLFSGKLGMIDDVVLHSSPGVRRFTDYGAGGNVEAHRALFLGRQAVGIAYGNANKNGTRVMWNEKLADYDNNVAIAAGMICGVKKTRFKPKNTNGVGTDFGVITMDTAARASY